MKIQKEKMTWKEAWALFMNIARVGSLAAAEKGRRRGNFSSEQLRMIDLDDSPIAPRSDTYIEKTVEKQ